MPHFHYKAVTNSGESVEGEMTANRQSVVIERLQDTHHTPISVTPIADHRHVPKKYNSLVLRRRNVQSDDIVLLTRELATLSNAGLPLDQALAMLENLTEHERVRKLIANVNQRVKAGATLSSAMESQGAVFSRLYLSTIRAGEASGALSVVLGQLAEYLEHMKELRSYVISALYYPAILSIVAFLSIMVLILFVIPQFVPLFEDMGQTLPVLTQVIFGLADAIRRFWWLIAAVIVLFIAFVKRRLARPDIRLQWDAFFLRTPLYGDLISKLEVARFSRTLEILLVNGVSLLDAIAIVQDIFTNRALAKLMDKVSSNLAQGADFAGALKQSPHFPLLAVQLIQVGEKTGRLEEMLRKISDIYYKDVRMMIKRLLTLLEPVIILIMGVIIALIIISILLAMLNLSDLVI